MSYVRPAKKQELVDWLKFQFSEEDSNYVTVTAEELASALIDTFDVVGKFKSL